MQNFSEFKTAVQKQFTEMKKSDLFRVGIDKDKLWEIYLSSFPIGTNPVFRERTSHDCQCCKSFVRSIGDVVAIKDGGLVSIWNVRGLGLGLNEGGCYEVVAKAMAEYVEGLSIENVFLHYESRVGVDKNFQQIVNKVVTWEHFFVQLPDKYICKKDQIGTRLGELRSTRDVFLRGLSEITMDAIVTVIELIEQGSLYRGEENKHSVFSFKKVKEQFDKATNKELFCWQNFSTAPTSVSKIRGTAIGTLLVDLSEGVEMDKAVASFEAKVAPMNYKRPTALVTKSMVEGAKEKLKELGLTSALERRLAVIEDITANNVLFANRTARKRMDDVFDEIAEKVGDGKGKGKKFDKVDEVGIEDFIAKILPVAITVEVMLENRHMGNMVSLIAPKNPTAPVMFKWDNGFSWSYNGEFADSIKARVKAAGGVVDADLRCSLSWFNTDDLDLHMIEPDGFAVYFGNKGQVSGCGGMLDVDMNVTSLRRDAVENICYVSKGKMKDGVYKLIVHNYTQRESGDVGFEMEVEFGGVVHTFAYPKVVKNNEKVVVAEIQYSKLEGFKILKSLPMVQNSKEVWGLSTNTFCNVSVMMLSPNYWDGKGVGNKHYFFMLEGCTNDGTARGFFNEFLISDLDKHRKVFELVGSKLAMIGGEKQLSGLGFSSTKKDDVVCRVGGTFTRVVKLIF